MTVGNIVTTAYATPTSADVPRWSDAHQAHDALGWIATAR